VFAQWDHILSIYKSSNPKVWRALLQPPFSLPAIAFHVAFALLMLSTVSMYWVLDTRYGPLWVFAVIGFSGGASIWTREVFAESHYSHYYTRHRIQGRRFLHREIYLRYAIFLEHLKRNNIDSAQARRMADFGEIADAEQTPLNLTQNAVVVLIFTIFGTLVVERAKLTAIWKVQHGDGVLIIAFMAVLLAVLYRVVMRGYRPPSRQTIQYLRWATEDLSDHPLRISLHPSSDGKPQRSFE
jgi:hypothetical protein